jgi:hypothetical protein
MDLSPPYIVYLNPITGEQYSTKFFRDMDIMFDGLVRLDHFNEAYGCNIQLLVVIYNQQLI